jgi:hypothetical protein
VKLVFRQHAVERMFERGLSVDDVASVLRDGRIIEDYPTDFPYRSALWLGLVGSKPLHVVAADNPAVDERIIITVYEPDPSQWESDWATRRKP